MQLRFVFGLVCVTTSYNVVSDFVNSADLNEPLSSTEVEEISIIPPPGAPTVARPQVPNSGFNRTRTRAAKVTLSIMGTNRHEAPKRMGMAPIQQLNRWMPEPSEIAQA